MVLRGEPLLLPLDAEAGKAADCTSSMEQEGLSCACQAQSCTNTCFAKIMVLMCCDVRFEHYFIGKGKALTCFACSAANLAITAAARGLGSGAVGDVCCLLTVASDFCGGGQLPFSDAIAPSAGCATMSCVAAAGCAATDGGSAFAAAGVGCRCATAAPALANAMLAAGRRPLNSSHMSASKVTPPAACVLPAGAPALLLGRLPCTQVARSRDHQTPRQHGLCCVPLGSR